MENFRFSYILKNLLKDTEISQKELSQKTGIPESSISSWLNSRKSIPNAEIVMVLADFFGCSMDYLAGRETEDGRIITNESPQNLPQPNKEEKAMLDIFSSLSRDGQYQILGFAEAISANEQRLRQLKKGNN